jgi:hypothetical protein
MNVFRSVRKSVSQLLGQLAPGKTAETSKTSPRENVNSVYRLQHFKDAFDTFHHASSFGFSKAPLQFKVANRVSDQSSRVQNPGFPTVTRDAFEVAKKKHRPMICCWARHHASGELSFEHRG